MKPSYLVLMSIISAVMLSACETIDETRYANVQCKDLKELVAAGNLASLSQPQNSGLYRTADDRENRNTRNIFDRLDDDTKRQAELRAAYRNNCKR